MERSGERTGERTMQISIGLPRNAGDSVVVVIVGFACSAMFDGLIASNW